MFCNTGIYNINLKQMKQETINLIKSMTGQGFLVIVDPEKLKGDEAVVVEVMNWKEESKPEIDLLQCDGRRFRAKIEGATCEGIISIEDSLLFLCQNNECGAIAKDKKGFKFSWRVHPPFTADGFENYDVTDFELLPEHRVIFTNCVGELFTEEDVKKNIEVWVGSISGKGLNKILNCPICDLTRDIFRGNDYETDIFRSKKSLLKYLYETCD